MAAMRNSEVIQRKSQLMEGPEIVWVNRSAENTQFCSGNVISEREAIWR